MKLLILACVCCFVAGFSTCSLGSVILLFRARMVG